MVVWPRRSGFGEAARRARWPGIGRVLSWTTRAELPRLMRVWPQPRKPLIGWTSVALFTGIGRRCRSLVDDAARAQIHLALSRVAYQDGQVSEALEQCQIVADLADRLGRTDLLVEAALVVKGIGGVPLESVLALCQRARSALGDEDSARHARVLAQHARVLADALNIDCGQAAGRARDDHGR